MAAVKIVGDPVVGQQWEGVTLIPQNDDRLVGLEVEVERCYGLTPQLQDPMQKRAALPDAPYWAAVVDNSLRNNGAEFVSFPMPIREVPKAVQQLFDWGKAFGLDWVSSVRTGIHVHVNVRDFNEIKLRNLLVTYPLVEPALFNYVGKEREECIYCVPWYRAPLDAHYAATQLSVGHKEKFHERLQNINRYTAKYSSLYLSPITRIGTVEFRHAPTWLVPEKISQWARICERIVSYAAKSSTYENVLDKYDSNPEMFVEYVTGGILDSPSNYECLVSKTGADFLARTMFPANEGDWVRMLDDYFPPTISNPKKPKKVTIKQYYNNGFPWGGSPDYGQTKPLPSGGYLIYDGHNWQKLCKTGHSPKHNDHKMGSNNRLYRWDETILMWIECAPPAEQAAMTPPPAPQVQNSMISPEFLHAIDTITNATPFSWDDDLNNDDHEEIS